MTDRDALMATILAHPDDDLPRLVFADYLDETGEEADAAHAEFIRVQCELSKTGKFISPYCCNMDGVRSYSVATKEYEYCDCQWSILRRREKGLIDCIPGKELLGMGFMQFVLSEGEYVPEFRPNHNMVFYRRGFLYAVICDGPTWLDHGVELAKQQPIEFVTLTTELPLVLSSPSFHDQIDQKTRVMRLRAAWAARRTDRSAEWYRVNSSEMFDHEYEISEREYLYRRNREEALDAAVQYFRDECRANATIEGYLSLKWPKVKFTQIGGEPPGPGRHINEIVTFNGFIWGWSGARWEQRGQSTDRSPWIPTWEEYQRRGRGEIIAGTYQRYMSEPMGMTTRPPTASWGESGESPLDAIRRARDEIMRVAPRPPEPPFFHDPV